MTTVTSRRRFLAGSGLAAMGTALAAIAPLGCAPAPAPSATPAPANPTAAVPTSAPAAAPTPTSAPAAAAPSPTAMPAATPAAAGPVATIRWQAPFPNPTSNQVIEPLIAKFEQEHPSIKIAPEAKLPWDKLTATFVAGTAADIVWGCCQYTADWITQKLAADLTDYTKNWADASAFIPAQWKWYQRQGHQFALPVYCATHGFFYNKQMFDEMKVPYPTRDDLTWNDLRPMAKALTKRTGNTVDWFGTEPGFAWDWEVSYMLWANGTGPFRDDSNSVCTLDDPKALDLLQWWADQLWVDKSAATPEEAKLNQVVGFSNFQSTKSAMTVKGSWYISPLTDSTKVPWGVFSHPKGTTGQRFTQTTTDEMIMFKDSKNKDATWEVMKFGTGVEWETAAMQPPGGMLQPSRVALLPKWGEIVLNYVKTINPAFAQADLDVFINAFKYGRSQPVFSDNAKAMEILQPAWDQVFTTGTAKAKDVIPPAVKAINEALKGIPSTLPT